MLDVALIWDTDAGSADFALVNGDLATDPGLKTALILSLFTDRLAAPGDLLPNNSADRRGFWGDLPVDPAAQAAGPSAADLTGSRLWLLDRALQTQETLRLAETYAEEALAWMVSDGVVGSVSAQASFVGEGAMQLLVTLAQAGASTQYAFAFSLAPDLGAPATATSVTLYLGTEAGALLTTEAGAALELD